MGEEAGLAAVSTAFLLLYRTYHSCLVLADPRLRVSQWCELGDEGESDGSPYLIIGDVTIP